MRLVPALAATSCLLLTVSLAACAGSPKAEKQYVEQPVEQLYNAAAASLDKALWEEAATGFEEVERQHPFSTWARRSTLMLAYAKYRLNEYDAAIDAAQRFIALHPGNDSAAYAYYLIAICNFEQILDVGRDQGTTTKAYDALTEVVRRFPDTEYARDAELKAQMASDQLAGKEMDVGRYYLSKDQHLSAINRFRRVVEVPNFQTTTHTPEALHRLVEAYLSLGLVGEAQKSAAVLGYNYPDSEWYARTYKLMTAEDLPVPKYGRNVEAEEAKAAKEVKQAPKKQKRSGKIAPPRGDEAAPGAGDAAAR